MPWPQLPKLPTAKEFSSAVTWTLAIFFVIGIGGTYLSHVSGCSERLEEKERTKRIKVLEEELKRLKEKK